MDESAAARLRDGMLAALSPSARDGVAAVIAATPHDVYAAGGAVRDALLGRPIVDLDLVVEDDAILVAHRAFPGQTLVTHARFRTASTAIDGIRIDITTARRETYARVAALPSIGPGVDIADDMRRRDFSINAMALRISGNAALIDPCGGAADLDRRQIRVLHDRSFIDDPTRIFRAIRYAARLAFDIEPQTARLLRDALTSIGALSGDRLRRELALMLREDNAAAALAMTADRGALRSAHPALGWDERRSAALGQRPPRIPLLPFGFALMAREASAADSASVVARLRLRRHEAEAVVAVPAAAGIEPMLRRSGAKPSGVALLLDRHVPAAVAAVGLASSDAIVRQVTLRYLNEWRYVKPRMTGADLERAGVPSGPALARGLQLIRAARLDGWAPDLADERAIALRFANSIRDSSAMKADVELHVNGD